ncbi:hypothetical protein [Spiroplasma endosymbiont of Stenodema calcarata]
MAGNCDLSCYACECTCKQAGDHPNCSDCRNCTSNDKHDRK